MLHATTAVFGVDVNVVVAAPQSDAVVVRVPGAYLALDADGHVTSCDRPAEPLGDTSPFTYEAFGEAHRLAWPGSGIRVKSVARTVFWGARFAAIVNPDSITIIDGIANHQARVRFPLCVPSRGCLAHAGRLWITGCSQIHHLPLAELEAVVESRDRSVPLVTRTVYPLHEPAARIPARVAWVFESGAALVNIGTQQVRFVGDFGLVHGATVVMCDRLYGTAFVAMEVPGRGRVDLTAPAPATTDTVAIVRGKSKDPAASGPPITASDPRVEALLADVARDPDDEGNRLVLVDLLQELGAQFGHWVAAGNIAKARRKDALGPLAHFLDRVVYKGALPWTAALVRRPPTDPALLAQAASDLRLGMFSTLRVAHGPKQIYARLVGSPHAIGLRRVDASEHEYAVAMIEGGRRHLTHLYDVRFTRGRLLAVLADPAFDSVEEIETVVQRQHVAGLVARLRADDHGLFRSPARRLVVRERHGYDWLLLRDLLTAFPALGVRDLTVGNLRVRRDDDDRLRACIGAASEPTPYWLEPLAAALPQLAEIELADTISPLAVAAAFPAAAVR